MHSIKFIRENKELIKDSLLKKQSNINLDELLDVDFKRRALIQEVETFKADKILPSIAILFLVLEWFLASRWL